MLLLFLPDYRGGQFAEREQERAVFGGICEVNL
jgi:hypothetical protein